MSEDDQIRAALEASLKKSEKGEKDEKEQSESESEDDEVEDENLMNGKYNYSLLLNICYCNLNDY